jgi:hypothetical protein
MTTTTHTAPTLRAEQFQTQHHAVDGWRATRTYLTASAPAEPEAGAPLPAVHLVEPLTARPR